MIDLAWGNSVAVRDAFIKSYNGAFVLFDTTSLSEFNYPPYIGDPVIIDITRQVIKRQLGLEYKHVFLVNGATGGCVLALRAYAQQGFEQCVTRNAPWYGRYPSMIKASGMQYHIDQSFWQSKGETVALIDLPSNPLGMMDSIAERDISVILDGVYLNKVYMPPTQVKAIDHDVLVGSYSKLLGLNGIRLGWIATNLDLMADRLSELIRSEYCGLSTASQYMLKTVLKDLNWDLFEATARYKMDMNREEWSILEMYFGDVKVTDVGMFYYAPMDKACQKLLTKAGVTWTPGSQMGTDDSFGRINLGQSNELVQKAVKAILKADGQ